MKIYCRFAWVTGILLPVLIAVLPEIVVGQSVSRTESGTPLIHTDFPFQSMWDDALRHAQSTHKPVLVFDLDLIDSNSLQIAREVIGNRALAGFISERFETALNDFAIDPPLSVGLDSLRDLGQRLSGLERQYRLAIRPTLLILSPDSMEIDRIVYPNRMNAAELQARLTEILEDRNTLGSMVRDFWRDTTSTDARQALIDKFEEHGLYDSVVYHLASLRNVADMAVSRAANVRYAALRLQVEGETQPIYDLIAGLGSSADDSALHLAALQQVLQHFQQRKMVDSTLAVYDALLHFTGHRDPSLLNDYAWYVGGYTKDDAKALALVDEALKARPSDPDFLDTRALILARQGKIDEAIAIEKRALELAPEEDKASFKDSLESLKERKKAMKEESKKTKSPKSKVKSKSK